MKFMIVEIFPTRTFALWMEKDLVMRLTFQTFDTRNAAVRAAKRAGGKEEVK